MNHYFENVPKLGNVAVSRHAQAQMVALGITEHMFTRTLLQPIKPDVPNGYGIIWRERDGIKIVILKKPEPFAGAMLVLTVYRIEAAWSVFRAGSVCHAFLIPNLKLTHG
jgi:hypothetical protein